MTYPETNCQFHLQGILIQHINGLKVRLAYPPTSVVYKHVFETLIRYHEIRSRIVGDLLELDGLVDYRYDGVLVKAPINIFLPKSYPSARPHVSIICPDGWAIHSDHMNINPNGHVTIPYIANWDEQSSDLVNLLSHLCVEFTCQLPVFKISAGAMTLSSNQVC